MLPHQPAAGHHENPAFADCQRPGFCRRGDDTRDGSVHLCERFDHAPNSMGSKLTISPEFKVGSVEHVCSAHDPLGAGSLVDHLNRARGAECCQIHE